jgi:hypothetical protein
MTPDRIKVKRDGPRGWHWIAAHNFDPAIHEAISDAPDAPVVKPPTANTANTAQPPRMKKTRGASSTSTEATHGDR